MYGGGCGVAEFGGKMVLAYRREQVAVLRQSVLASASVGRRCAWSTAAAGSGYFNH